MKLYGFQKMTLLDFPGKVACTVFTGGCNFRCPFCHNALLVTETERAEEYDEDEIINFLKKRHGLLDGVAVTGGEPLMSEDIIGFIERIKAEGFPVKLDTNGSYPDRLKRIIDGGLVDYVAMDIKNSKELYAETIGLPSYDTSKIEKSVEILLNNRVDYEFRTTVVRQFHTVESITEAARWIKWAKRYFLQNFIDSGNLIGDGLCGVPPEEMRLMRDAASQFVAETQLRGI